MTLKGLIMQATGEVMGKDQWVTLKPMVEIG